MYGYFRKRAMSDKQFFIYQLRPRYFKRNFINNKFFFRLSRKSSILNSYFCKKYAKLFFFKRITQYSAKTKVINNEYASAYYFTNLLNHLVVKPTKSFL